MKKLIFLAHILIYYNFIINTSERYMHINELFDQWENETKNALEKQKLSLASIKRISNAYQDLKIKGEISIKDLFNKIITSDIPNDLKQQFKIDIKTFFWDLLTPNDQHQMQRISDSNLNEIFQALQTIFNDELETEEIRIIKTKIKELQKKLKKLDKKSQKISPQKTDYLQDFLNEPVPNINEIPHRYYQTEQILFIPYKTTISDVLDQIIEKMHDSKYEPYKHMLKNIPQDLERIFSGYYGISSKPSDQDKDKKYFAETNPIITAQVIKDELNKRIELYKASKIQST